MITLKQARKHAKACDMLTLSGTDALPLSGNAHDNPVSVFLAHPVVNPENLSVIYAACTLLTASMLANLAIKYGVDYVVVFTD